MFTAPIYNYDARIGSTTFPTRYIYHYVRESRYYYTMAIMNSGTNDCRYYIATQKWEIFRRPAYKVELLSMNNIHTHTHIQYVKVFINRCRHCNIRNENDFWVD